MARNHEPGPADVWAILIPVPAPPAVWRSRWLVTQSGGADLPASQEGISAQGPMAGTWSQRMVDWRRRVYPELRSRLSLLLETGGIDLAQGPWPQPVWTDRWGQAHVAAHTDGLLFVAAYFHPHLTEGTPVGDRTAP